MHGNRPRHLARPCLALLAAFTAAQAQEDDNKGTYALYFGAPCGTVTVADPAIADDGPGLTVEFRFKTLGKLPGSSPVAARWAAGPKDSDRGTFCLSVGPGEVTFELLNAAGKPKTLRARTTWKDGAWHHVAAVWDGTEALVYLDGKRVVREKLEGFGPLATSKLPLVIGALSDLKKRPKGGFEGFLSDVAIWNVGRDADAIAAAPKAPLTCSEPGLAMFLPLREHTPGVTVQGLAGKAVEGGLSPALARAGWCRTPWWFEERPDRPWVHLFSYDLSGETGVGRAARRVVVSNEARGDVGVLWQDETTRKVHVTWVDASLEAHRTVDLAGMEGGTLAAGTADPRGNLIHLMIEASRAGAQDDASLRAALYLAAADGKPLRETALDTSQDQLNVTDYGGRWTGSMAFFKDTACLILPRRMHRSEDGLQHQSAVAAAFGADLSRFQILGQTSSHSFGNLLTVNSSGEFIGLDLGDNFPRGLHLHRLGRASRASSVIFTYKTAHATEPGNGFPAYTEISGKGRKFYKWSNDNDTYTELGGIVETKSSYVVVFSADRSPDGKVLDCSRIGVPDDPRDLAMLRVVKNFERGTGGTQVADALMAALPPGAAAETGGYFDFGGRWVPQRITGVQWLTHHASGEGAHAPQLARRRDGSLLILWEKSGPQGRSLRATTVDESGKKPSEEIDLGVDLRLVPEGVPLRIGDRVFTLALDGSGGTRLCFVQDE